MQDVVVQDGINEWEANVIAKSYFARFGPGCGAVYDVIDENMSWVGRTVVGYGAMPTEEPIRIDKHTGRVTWHADNPVITDPKKLW